MDKEAKVVQEASVSTMPVIGIPHIDPVVKEQPKGDPNTSTALIVGVVSGIIGSYFGPLLKTFVKHLLKKLLKKGGPNSEERKEDKETDCRTHKLQCTIRSKHFSDKISELQKNLEELANDRRYDLSHPPNISELEERLNKVEKNIKKKG